MLNQTRRKLQLHKLLLTLAPQARTLPINVNRLVHEHAVTMTHSFHYLIVQNNCWYRTSAKLGIFNVMHFKQIFKCRFKHKSPSIHINLTLFI